MEIPVSHYDFSKEKEPKACSVCDTLCTKKQYCSTTQSNLYLCFSCYTAGKYPASQKSGDFVVERFSTDEEEEEKKKILEDEEWDEKEEELLKEGLGLYEDQWEKVADHVGTRTHDECILHYLQLPMDDPFEDAQVAQLGLLQYDLIEHRENPIMAAVAFLASAVKPQVAAACGNIDAIEIIPVKKQDIEEKNSGEKEDQDIKMENEVKDEDIKPIRSEEEEASLLELTSTLIKHKLEQYESQTSNYEELENIVEEQKRRLEKERRLLDKDQSELKMKIMTIRQAMAKKIQSSQPPPPVQHVATSSMTPALLQQKLANVSPSMFLNNNQQIHHQQSPQVLQQLQFQQQQQQQQQQYHLQQMQIRMQQQQQQQQQQHDQVRPQGPPGFNNVMSM